VKKLSPRAFLVSKTNVTIVFLNSSTLSKIHS
jgi:hypothetical protein